ncbi:HEAT repeat domain-containing protein [candidate division WOR-3 bacterium]|nr:HEAT repeat domain-containing protein [candidate division WOR-3 bacterium]
MVCPQCRNAIEQNWFFCAWCGVNIVYYHKALEYINHGKHLEEIYRYDEALTSYQKAVSFGIASDTVDPLLEKVSKLLDRFIYLSDKGRSLKRKGKWRAAYLSLRKASLLNPIDDSIKRDLTFLKDKLQKRLRRKIIYIVTIFTLLVVGGTSYLWYINTPQYLARKTLIKSTYSTNAVVRRRAIEAMGNVGDRRFLPIIREYLADSDTYVRQEAIRALFKIEDTASVEYIRPLMKDDDERVRITAAKLLADMGDSSAMNYLRRFVNRGERSESSE